MARIPEPDRTPDGPRYEGRVLDRPHDEVVDQGLRFDVDTLLNRRNVLVLLGAGAGSLALAACSTGPDPRAAASSTPSPSTPPSASPSASASAPAPVVEIPEETAGPFPGNGTNGADVLENAGIIRRDIRSSIGGGGTADGVPMSLTLTIVDMANGGAPFAGAAVYIWHCNAVGGYSMYSDGIEDETYLRGVQLADASGTVTFESIVPGCYTGRWPHVHFEVYPSADAITDASNVIATSQVALPQDTCDAVYALEGYGDSARELADVTLRSDMVFGEDGGESQLGTVTGDTASGYAVELTVGVDTRTAP